MRSSGSKKPASEAMYFGGGAELDVALAAPGSSTTGSCSLNSSSWAPGGATTLKVGLGMYSLILFFSAILVRPLTSRT